MLTNYKIITIQAIKFHKLIRNIATTFSTTRTITYIPSNSAIDTQRRSLVARPGRLLPPLAAHLPVLLRSCAVPSRAPLAEQGRREAGSRRSLSLLARPACAVAPLGSCAPCTPALASAGVCRCAVCCAAASPGRHRRHSAAQGPAATRVGMGAAGERHSRIGGRSIGG